jgi:hypothetical protein
MAISTGVGILIFFQQKAFHRVKEEEKRPIQILNRLFYLYYGLVHSV